MGGTWAEHLARERDAHFEGREHEQSLLCRLMSHPRARLLHLHGPAGIGKTWLTWRYQRMADARGWPWVRIDVQHGIHARVFRQVSRRLGGRLGLLIIDDVDQADGLESRIRDVFLPALDDATRVVMTSRVPLCTAWGADPGFHALLWTHQLQRAEFSTRSVGVSASSSRAPPDARAIDLPSTPAALAPSDDERIVRALQRFRSAEPALRRAIALAAVNRLVTPQLLKAQEEPGRAARDFAWLCREPFVEVERLGVSLHTCVRQPVLDALSSEDRSLSLTLLDWSLEHTLQAVQRAPTCWERDVWIDNGLSLLAWQEHGRAPVPSERLCCDPLARAERPGVLEMVQRQLGASAAKAADYWIERTSESALVSRNTSRQIAGYCHFLDLRAVHPALSCADPAFSAAQRWLDGLRLGSEKVLICRFFCPGAGAFSLDNPQVAFLMAEMQRRLLLSEAHVVLSAQPSWVLRQLGAWGKHPVRARYCVDGIEWSICGYDLRAHSPFQIMRRPLAEKSPAPGLSRPQIFPPTRAEFERVVRSALGSFQRADRLAESPLANWLGLDGNRGQRANAMRERLRNAALEFGASGDDARHLALLEATYFRGAAKQRAAADELGMGFSTYRRHLKVAVSRLETALWEMM